MAQNFVRHAFLLFRQEKAYGAIHLYALKCGDFWLRILKEKEFLNPAKFEIMEMEADKVLQEFYLLDKD